MFFWVRKFVSYILTSILPNYNFEKRLGAGYLTILGFHVAPRDIHEASAGVRGCSPQGARGLEGAAPRCKGFWGRSPLRIRLCGGQRPLGRFNYSVNRISGQNAHPNMLKLEVSIDAGHGNHHGICFVMERPEPLGFTLSSCVNQFAQQGVMPMHTWTHILKQLIEAIVRTTT